MVDDDVMRVHGSEAVPAVGTVDGHILVAQSEADEADDVVGTGLHGIVGDADAVAGSRLSGDGGVLGNLEGRFEVDGAGDVEEDGPGSGLRQRPAQRALRSGIVAEVGDVIDGATAAAGRVSAKAFGAREGERLFDVGRRRGRHQRRRQAASRN